MATMQKLAIVVKKIIELKKQGIAQSDIAVVLTNMNIKPPSAPTIRKYYNMDDAPSAAQLTSAFEKPKAFEDPQCKEIILTTLAVNKDNVKFTISSLYDLLEEELVDTGVMNALPGNEQTLRNYCTYLRKTGQVPEKETQARLYNFVEDPPPGKQIQLDYGVQRIDGGEQVYFICIRVRRSRVLFVQGQDHRFNAVETCRSLYLFFIFIGGRFEELVIDQDSALVSSEFLGEVVETQVFKEFLREQELKLFVCRKADPESKGSVENLVGFVKKNYFSSRLDRSSQKLIAGLGSWCKRKNTRRLNCATHRIPMEHFEQEEKATLRPNLPSSYGGSTTLMPVEGDKTRTIRYKTNRYSFPPEYRFKTIYYRAAGGVLSIYSNEDGTKLIRQHDIAPSHVKNTQFMHPQDLRKPSEKWKELRQSLLRRYHCPSMIHFINGVCKENDRYKGEQLRAILKYLDGKKPEMEFLETVVARCCSTYSYKVAQFQAIYEGLQKEMSETDVPDVMAFNANVFTMPVDVQVRDQDFYQSYFTKKVNQSEGEAL